MATQRFTTNLRCEGCISAIKPLLDAAPTIRSWSADVTSPDKVLTIESTQPLTVAALNTLLQPAGYQAKSEVADAAPANSTPEAKASYYPLLLILLYLLGITAAIEWNAGRFDLERAMRQFMAGFFLVFSFFKLLNLTSFADAYSTYDVVAKRSRAYALAYPFIELALGLAYVMNLQPRLVNLITLIVMAISTIGVVQSLVSRKQIRCACLGTVFTLPMSVVTLVEDLLMVAMSAAMLVM